jgi:hypothetical protein
VVLLRGVAAEPVRIDLELAETLARATLEDRGTEQPENMTEQAERPLNLKDECRGVDKCGPKWPGRGPKHRFGGGGDSSNAVLLQRYSSMERVTGIEPALSAWEEFLSQRVSVCFNDFGGLS